MVRFSDAIQRVSRKASGRNIPQPDVMPTKAPEDAPEDAPENTKSYADKFRAALSEPKQENAVKPKKESWRANFTDTEKQKRRENVRRGVQAIGDVLRRMGNLYYTTKGASPQEYAFNPYAEWQREEREAKAHELAQQKIQAAKDKADADNLYKMQNLELAKLNAEGKAKLNDANVALKNNQAELAKKKGELQDLINSKTPEELAEKIRKLKAAADKEEAAAKQKGVQADNEQGLIDAKKDNLTAGAQQKRASASSSAANAQYKRIQTQGLSEGYIETNQSEVNPEKTKKSTTKTKRVATKNEVKAREVKKKKKINW